MSLTMDQIAETFCRHNFSEIYPYMTNNIKWNIIGEETLMGREAVINQCEQSAKFLEAATTTITKLKLNSGKNFVAVEGSAQYRDQDNQVSGVASCDVFQFSDGKLIEISSYNIALKIL